ncbi:hypothetical protein KC19_9G121100 [Ceratodon purpureus]|uniref:Uncharacterized protein n=1 Tax=Ceratodon purpureus TaxID=3225 RepID=A0A8T0GVH8_CERPU|nr:hypothetical protein KC19_9G121100 [Ceratodon purpureus]
MLQSLLPRKPVMWNDLISGSDHTLTKRSLPQQSSFFSTSAFSGKESMTGKDDVKSEPFSMGSADLGNLMGDPYTEEDARILSTACYFASDDVEDPEEGMPLFGAVSDGIRTDYNWEQCFGNLEDVDNLLSSGPELTFGSGPAGPVVDSMQWHDSASPPDVQPENMTIAKSSLRSECGATAKGNSDATDLGMEFVPGDAQLAQPTLEKAQVGVKTVDYMPADERWNSSQSGTQFLASDCLEDGEAMDGDAPLPKLEGGTCVGMDMSEDGAGASSVSYSDSEKASMAQFQRARRHAANRKRIEERSRRQLNHRKFIHGSAYSNSHVLPPHMLQPIPMQLTAHANHFSQPQTAAALYGFVAPRSNLASMQPMIRPAPPYIHVGYTPSIRHIQPVPPTPVSSQTGLFMGVQKPASFQANGMMSPHPQFQLRSPVDAPICPPLSSSSMTPQEKIEKLKYLQQMQARLAVEHQQQQFVAQGAAPIDSSLSPSLGNVPAAQLPQIMPLRQPDVPVTTVSEMKISAVESDFELSLSVGQTSLDTAPEDEGGSMEAVVLDKLQNTVKSLEVETKLCIRDALYRLARSAMRRNGSGGRGGGEESGNNTQTTGDAASDGLESSTNSDPCSSSRVSRMNMNLETQTNPIDRSIAHLLFHKTEQQQAPAQSAPSNFVAAQVLGIPDGQTNPSTWHKGDMPQNSWQPASHALPVTGPVQGVEIGAAAGSIRPPMALVIPSTLMGPRFQGPQGMASPLIISDGGQQMQNGMNLGTGNIQNGDSLLSPMGSSQCQPRSTVEEQRPLQAQAAAVAAVPVAPQKVSLDCRNGIRNTKRLEHALGLKELSQLLSEGLDADSASLCKEETVSGSPMSNNSSVRNEEGQANSHQQSRSYPSQPRIHRQAEAMRSC